MREKRNRRASKMFEIFRNLGGMEAIRFEPLRPWRKSARFLSDIFHCADEVREVRCGALSHSMIQPFILEKLLFSFAKMRSNKRADTQGLILEMLKKGGPVLWQTLFDLYNKMGPCQFPATGDRLLEYRSNTRVSPNFRTSV